MKVPFFDLSRIYPDQKEDLNLAAKRVLESGWYVLGKECAAFEAEMKNSLVGENGIGSVIGCNSGTDALLISLLACGVGPGDEVITVSHTAIPTLTAIRSTGAKPVLIDIHPDTWLMDETKISMALSPRTKAVIPVHLYGAMVDVVAIQEVLKEQNRLDISVIEDVAQAQGSLWNGREAGTLGRFGSYSFYPTKNLGAFGDGGGIFASQEEDAKILRMLRFYGQESRYNAQISKGINSRLDEIQAAFLRLRLPRIQKESKRKSEWVSQYLTELSGLPVRFQQVHKACDPAWHLFVIRLEDETVREQLSAALKKVDIETLIHYPVPAHRQPAFHDLSASKLPETEKLASQILSLPMNSKLLPQECEKVVREVRNFFLSKG